MSHRKENGEYKGTWTEKGNGSEKSNVMSKADVSALIREHEERKQKEAEEATALKASIIDDLKQIVDSSVVAAMAASPNAGKRILQRAGAPAKVSGVSMDTTYQEGIDAKAERCASNLIAKFGSIGSKAKNKVA